MRWFTLVCLIGFFYASCFSQPCNSLRYADSVFHQVNVTTGVYFGTATPYGTLAQPQDLYFDFYEPAGDTLSKRPLIIFQFGGGFTIGWRSEPLIPDFCTYFAKCGYAVATIDYRIGLNALDTNSTIRAYYRGIQDERAAIRFLAQNATQYKIDTSLVILTGTSAGCFCALANAYTTDADRPASSYGSLLEPSDLGCMDCSGNTALGYHIPKIKAIINQWGAILDTGYITAAEGVPVISFHGDQDNLVPFVYGYPFSLPVFPGVYGSVPIHQRLSNQNIVNEFHPLVGYGHEPELLNPGLNDTIYHYSREFLYQLLRPKTSVVDSVVKACTMQSVRYSVELHPLSKYCWTLEGNGTITFNGGNYIDVVWVDTGLVSVKVTEVNAIDAKGEEVIFVTDVYPEVVTQTGYSVNELSVAFLSINTNANSVVWNFGDGVIDSGIQITHDYITGGSYQITQIASNGGCADTALVYVIVDSCPVASFTYTTNNLQVFLNASNTNTQTYNWLFGDGQNTSSNFPNVFYQYATPGLYTVDLVVTNALGCSDTASVQIDNRPSGIEKSEPSILIEANLEGWKVESANDFNLRVYNTLGQEMASANCFNSCFVRYDEIGKGVFIAVFTIGNKTYFKKVYSP